MLKQPKANERTFQGVFNELINTILKEKPEIQFKNILQEQNIGVGESRFADGMLYSKIDTAKSVLFELKNNAWDATASELVTPACMKAMRFGISYFVTGTPKQLAIYQTFKEGTSIQDRKLKIYQISNVKSDNDATSDLYVSQIKNKVIDFLKDLDGLIHGTKIIVWDSIDRVFVNKLSSYILDASVSMFESAYKQIHSDKKFQRTLQDFLKSQDFFSVTGNFDNDDVMNICLVKNYLLYLKILFYSCLQRNVPYLTDAQTNEKYKLKDLEIPKDTEQLNKALKERFADVLKHDYETIFAASPLDDLAFPQAYTPTLRKNVEEIKNLDFNDLDADIIGAIYNELLDNNEQHDLGQHFTNTNEVDLVNAFCINEKTQFVMDSSCGAGTFLVRAYKFLNYYQNNNQQKDTENRHQSVLEQLWGVEIAAFPCFLANMNLALLDVKQINNYPVIIQSDFCELDAKSNPKLQLIMPNKSKLLKVTSIKGEEKKKNVKIPQFDACVGNPPYIRQEIMAKKPRWQHLVELDYPATKKINAQSDLYAYFLIHTTAFLKEGGRLGYVVSSSWLDANFGGDLQKFLLDNFKIIAIIDHQKKRSFETASVNSVILIIEKCTGADNRTQREKNEVRFIRVFEDYEKLLGKIGDHDRLLKVQNFVDSLSKPKKDTENAIFMLTMRKQSILETESTIKGKYTNGNWGAKYLRSPKIFTKILNTAGAKLVPLNDIAKVKRGITSGINDFFYVQDETAKALAYPDDMFLMIFGYTKDKIDFEKYGYYLTLMAKIEEKDREQEGTRRKPHHSYLIEREFMKPLFKTQREAENLEINPAKLKYCVFICNKSKNELIGTKALRYIQDAEELDLHLVASVRSRPYWYALGKEIFVGDFVFPSKIFEIYGMIDNRLTKTLCDKVSYNVSISGKNKLGDISYLLMNSTFFRFYLELFARQMGGGLTDIDVSVLQKGLIPDPILFKKHEKELKKILASFKGREQESIFEEIKKEDRKQLDKIIFDVLGLDTQDLEDFYLAVCKYRTERTEKANSLSTSKTKNKLTDEASLDLIERRFPEVRLYDDLLLGKETKDIIIPDRRVKIPRHLLATDVQMFEDFSIIWEDNRKMTFDHKEQFNLFYFFYDKLKVRNVGLTLPVDSQVCASIRAVLEFDFAKNFEQIQVVLKTSRSKANAFEIYKKMIFEGK